MLPRLSFALAAIVLCLAACQAQPPAPESPGQCVQSILELYEARNFDTLIR